MKPVAIALLLLPLGPAAARQMWLSDLPPVELSQGWGGLGLDRSVQGNPLAIVDRHFEHGLGTHAVSRLVYDLDGQWTRLTAWVGIDAEMRGQPVGATVVFQVKADGKLLFDSGVMKQDTPAKRVDVDLTGAASLELLVGDAGDGITADHADWAEAQLVGPDPSPTTVAKPEFTVGGVSLAADGTLVAPALGGTRLGGCRVEGEVKTSALDGGGREFERGVVSREGHRATVIERFTPTPDSVRWEVEIRGLGEPWTTPIRTALHWPAADKARFWTGWQNPERQDGGWSDPLVPQPFVSRTWSFGGPPFAAAAGGGYVNDRGEAFSLPLATVLDPAADHGWSLVLSPRDVLLDLQLTTSRDGDLVLTRLKHRIDPRQPIKFTMDLAPHAGDWRGGLGWMVAHYPEFFDPPNPAVAQMAGCGAYSADDKPYELTELKQMSFRLNWKASIDFPYMGMFLPPLTRDDELWRRSPDDERVPGKSDFNSFASLNAYSRYLQNAGCYCLNYFNVTEFGRQMQWPEPPRQAATDADLWKDPNDWLYAKQRSALLMSGGKPILTCYNAFVVDPGDAGYQAFMLAQAQRHLDHLPASAGICIDRTDWLRWYNLAADDGASWIDGRPARFLGNSWKAIMARLGPLMHGAGKVIFINPLYRRLDLLAQVDGLYDEFGQVGACLNGSALMGLRKPVVAWTPGPDTLKPDPDAYFQRLLYLGVYPTAPYPGNNHCLKPSAFAAPFYRDYGPLLDAIRGKQWVLAAHCIEVDGPAKANLFAVPGGWVAPVMLGGAAEKVTVRVRGVAAKSCEAVYPGQAGAVGVNATVGDGGIVLQVPLRRGCALLRLR
jgi:hypothetical protein